MNRALQTETVLEALPSPSTWSTVVRRPYNDIFRLSVAGNEQVQRDSGSEEGNDWRTSRAKKESVGRMPEGVVITKWRKSQGGGVWLWQDPTLPWSYKEHYCRDPRQGIEATIDADTIHLLHPL